MKIKYFFVFTLILLGLSIHTIAISKENNNKNDNTSKREPYFHALLIGNVEEMNNGYKYSIEIHPSDLIINKPENDGVDSMNCYFISNDSATPTATIILYDNKGNKIETETNLNAECLINGCGDYMTCRIYRKMFEPVINKIDKATVAVDMNNQNVICFKDKDINETCYNDNQVFSQSVIGNEKCINKAEKDTNNNECTCSHYNYGNITVKIGKVTIPWNEKKIEFTNINDFLNFTPYPWERSKWITKDFSLTPFNDSDTSTAVAVNFDLEKNFTSNIIKSKRFQEFWVIDAKGTTSTDLDKYFDSLSTSVSYTRKYSSFGIDEFLRSRSYKLILEGVSSASGNDIDLKWTAQVSARLRLPQLPFGSNSIRQPLPKADVSFSTITPEKKKNGISGDTYTQGKLKFNWQTYLTDKISIVVDNEISRNISCTDTTISRWTRKLSISLQLKPKEKWHPFIEYVRGQTEPKYVMYKKVLIGMKWPELINKE